MARPFQAATTLSSRPGRGRRERAASSRSRTAPIRSASTTPFPCGSWRTEAPSSKVPAGVTPKYVAANSPSAAAEFGGELGRRPDVVGAFGGGAGAVVAVGVQRGGEPALGGGQFGDEEVRGLQRDPAGQVGAGGAPQVGVDPDQQRVVVEHLLEVRHRPGRVDAVAGEAARELVVDAAAGHRLAGVAGHLERVLGAGAGVVAQQELQRHRRRELRRAAESAALGVVGPGQVPQRGAEFALARGAAVGPGVRPGPLAEFAHDPVGDLGHLGAAVLPGGDHAVQHLHEAGQAVPGLGREVRAEVERLALGRQEHRHRPAALAGGRLHRLHVHRVDVGALLAVHLHRDEVGVEVVGRGRVLEGLVGHHMAPVTANCNRRQQNGYVTPPRLLERLRRPGPPVDGVVGVLEEVRGGRVSQAVHHAGSIAAPAAGTPKPERTGGVNASRSIRAVPPHVPPLRSRAAQQPPPPSCVTDNN